MNEENEQWEDEFLQTVYKFITKGNEEQMNIGKRAMEEWMRLENE